MLTDVVKKEWDGTFSHSRSGGFLGEQNKMQGTSYPSEL